LTRVLFLTESFHPVLGGGETHIRRLATALVAAGGRATVVTRRGEPAWAAAEELDGVRVVRVPPSGPGRSGKYRMVLAAMAAVRREAPRHDVLVVRGTRVLGLPGLLAARGSGLATVMQPEINGELDASAFTWGTAWEHGAGGSLLRAALRTRNLWLRDAERFVAMSRRIRDELREAGVDPRRIALIPHGVDTARFRPIADASERDTVRARLALPRAATLAVYTGRLLRGKGLETLLEAFAVVARERSDVALLLVGSGAGQSLSVEDELRRRASELALAERVIFAGRSERVESWLQAADIFVFPSQFEALGISLLEAAACGLPAIGSRTGGIVDVIEDGGSGLLVPPGDVRALAQALLSLAHDSERRRTMGARARRRALACFDERDSLARYLGLFAEITPARPRASRPGRAPRGGGGPPPSPAAPA
jgi:glycosyltransferase involved in cell wall biosynthesis